MLRQHQQCDACINLTLRGILAPIVAVKNAILHILSVCM